MSLCIPFMWWEDYMNNSFILIPITKLARMVYLNPKCGTEGFNFNIFYFLLEKKIKSF